MPNTQVQPEVQVVPHDPQFLQSDWGAVAIFGHELVSKKVLLILQQVLHLFDFEEQDHCVRSIVLRDDGFPMQGGKAMLGLADPASGAISINLLQVFSRAVDNAVNTPNYSIECMIHQELLITLLHEVNHITTLWADADYQRKMANDPAFKKQVETDATTWAVERMYALAKAVDIEPAHISESPFFATQLMELLTGDDSEFVTSQKWMHENGIMFHKEATDTEDGLTLNSFKHVLHLMSGDDVDDESWAEATIGADEEADVVTVEGVVEEPSPETAAALEQAADVATPEGWVPPSPEPTPATSEVVAPPVNAGQTQFAQPLAPISDNGYDDIDTSYAEYADGPTYVAPEQQVQQQFTPAAAGPPVQQQAAPTPWTPVNQPQAPAQPQQWAPANPDNQPSVQVYPDNGIAVDDVKRIMFGLYQRIYTHLFTYCGRGTGFPEYDAQMNDGTPIFNAQNVYRMPLRLSPEEMAVVVKCDGADANGNWTRGLLTSNGVLPGFISKTAKLPMYKLHLNVGGHELLRVIVPQNPTKPGKYGDMARRGVCILHIMEGDDTITNATDAHGRKTGKRFLLKCTDGHWESF